MSRIAPKTLSLDLSDDESVLVVGDSHLTTFDPVWMQRCGDALLRFDGTIVLLGDFWDGYHISEDRFLQEWSIFLTALQKKRCFYIPGNHDKWEWNTQSHQFATAMVKSLELRFPKYTVHCEHGDNLAPDIDWYAPTLAWYLSSIPYRWYSFHKPWFLGRNAAAKAYREYEKRQQDTTDRQKILCFGHIHAAVIGREKNEIRYVSPGLYRGGHPKSLLFSNSLIELVSV